MNGRRVFVGGLVLALSLCSAGSTAAQTYGGFQANVGSDTDFGLGGRLLFDLEGSNLEFVGSFDIYFPDGFDYWEINGNLFYHFDLPDAPTVLPYAGGGLNLAHFSNGGSDTEAGFNLGGGVRFLLDRISPFIEVKTVVGDADQSVLTFGMIVGRAHGH